MAFLSMLKCGSIILVTFYMGFEVPGIVIIQSLLVCFHFLTLQYGIIARDYWGYNDYMVNLVWIKAFVLEENYSKKI